MADIFGAAEEVSSLKGLETPSGSSHPGSRTPDHFDLYWEVTPHRSTASLQVTAIASLRRR
jgi:hypothetical protein